MNTKRGVYFLANDYILELVIAFLKSFRKFNPDIPLCLIPYDSNFKKVANLKNIYNFSIFSDDEVLDACDKISMSFYDSGSGSFRKLALWEGPFDEFIYIDSDTVVLTNVEFSFKYLSEYDFITSHSSVPSIRKWVWKDSIDNVSVLSKEQINYAANTGYIISYKKALPLALAQEKLSAGLELKEHMELFCGEQPFLNYLFVTSGKYTSLFTLFNKDPFQKIPLEFWGGDKGVVVKGNIYFMNENNNPVPTSGEFRQNSFEKWLYIKLFRFWSIKKEMQILLVHWAGIYRPNNFEKWAYHKLFKFLGIKAPCASFFMPNKQLWKYYRYMKIN
jgi:hypothetical protein